MAFKVLRKDEASWRRSNQMGVLNTDLARQLESKELGARLWRLQPGQASTRHRHRETEEFYLLLEGIGKLRVDDQLIVLEPMDSVVVEPESFRQLLNDTGEDQPGPRRNTRTRSTCPPRTSPGTTRTARRHCRPNSKPDHPVVVL